MGFPDVLLIALLIFGYAVWSRWLTHRSISGPMVFGLIGAALGGLGVTVLVDESSTRTVEVLAEATLVVVLFSDATRIDLRRLRENANIPLRMLGIGLPLTIALGTLAGRLVFGEFHLIEAAVLAAVLAPTDAALGQAVVSDQRVPLRIRQALNVESGLNDGLMVPVVTVLVAIAAAEAGESDWIDFVARQLGFGLLVGIVVGALMGRVIELAHERGLAEGAFRQIAVLAVAAAAFTGAESLEGNGFVAAFVAGLAFGAVARSQCTPATEFIEDEGELLVLLTFFFWGLLLLAPRFDELTPRIAVYVVLSLTVVRMVPVAISLLGTRLEWPSMAYLGWFGPRGLASILFVQLVVEELESDAADRILTIVTWTALASIVAHGLSSVPLAGRYGSWFESMTDDQMTSMPEAEEVADMPVRGATRLIQGGAPHGDSSESTS